MASGAIADRDRPEGRSRSANRGSVNAVRRGRIHRNRALQEEPAAPTPAVEVRFVPDTRVLESVLAQIKSGHLAYSVFSLARMFLDKPERYDVRLKAETAALFQLGEHGPVARDRRVLENGAFLSEKDNFYRTEVDAIRTDQRQFHLGRALPAERDLVRSDQSSRLSAAVAQSLRAALQPANEFSRLSAAD